MEHVARKDGRQGAFFLGVFVTSLLISPASRFTVGVESKKHLPLKREKVRVVVMVRRYSRHTIILPHIGQMVLTIGVQENLITHAVCSLTSSRTNLCSVST